MLTWVAALASVGLVGAIAACSSSAGSTTAAASSPASAAATASSTASARFASLLPSQITEAGTISDASAFDYPPFDSTSSSGAFVGGEVDMLNDAAALLGVKMSYQRLTEFSSLLPAVTSGRVDMAAESFGVTTARLAEVDYVEYGGAGEGLLVAKGNPSGISLSDICGHSLSIEAGAIEATYYALVSKTCVAGGKQPIKLDIYSDEPSQLLAVESGHDDAMAVGSTTTASIAADSGGKLVSLPGIVPGTLGAIGVIVPKTDVQLAKALDAALTYMDQNGTLTTINNKWDMVNVVKVRLITSASQCSVLANSGGSCAA